MPTQEERIQSLISRLQGPDENIQTGFDDPKIVSSFAPQEYYVEPIQPGSIMGMASGMPMPEAPPPQRPPIIPVTPPPVDTSVEGLTGLDLFTGVERGLVDQPLIQDPDESDNPFLAFGRGIGRGGMQTGIAIGECIKKLCGIQRE